MIVGKLDHCDYPTIQEAVDALEKQDPQRPETLYILSGVYEEAVRIYRSDLAVIGIGYVEITKGRYAKELDENGNEIGTFATPTLFLGGRRLLIENLVVTTRPGRARTSARPWRSMRIATKRFFATAPLKGTRTRCLPDRFRLRPSMAACLEESRSGSITESTARCTNTAGSKGRWILYSAARPPSLTAARSAACAIRAGMPVISPRLLLPRGRNTGMSLTSVI